MTYWRLQIQTGTTIWKIQGAEEVMRAAYDEIEASLRAGDMPNIIRVEGYSDTYDRADMSILVRTCEINAVELGKMA